jgi:hypothetical protein
MHLWCELLHQATLTLNLLRTSRINPTISAATQIFGQFDFNRTLLAPPGIRAVAHVSPKARGTWAPHGEDVWYVRPAPDHYRCYKVCMVATNRTRIVDTVEFSPQHVKMPHLSSQEMAIQAARELTFALRNPAPAAPFARMGYQQHEALAKLANIFKEIAAPEPSGEVIMTTTKSIQKPIPSIPHTEVPVSIPPLLKQPRFTPTRVYGVAPRVEAPSTRVNRTAVKIMTPVTNTHRMLDRGIKTPTAIPPFDLYKQRRQTAQSTPRNVHSTVPERVVTYLGDTTQQLLADLQAETGRYYNTRSRARNQTANVITRFIPSHNRSIESEYDMHMANEVTNDVTGETLNLRKLLLNPETRPEWQKGNYNEYDRLFQGHKDGIKGTDTFFFIEHKAVPKGLFPTYVKFVCAYKPHKSDPHRVRMTVGGDRIEYPGEVATKTADLTVTKAIINSVCSTKAALYMNMDIKNYYLGTPLERYEYIRIPISMVPDKIMDEYNLHALVHNSYLYIEVRKGMYGLPQAGILADVLLAKRLAKHGYITVPHTHGLWTHKWRPIKFSLVVDDFGVMYVGREHAEHLKAALEENYEISNDWEGSLYCGIKLFWDYAARTVDLSMPGYIAAILHIFQHPYPARPQHAPYKMQPINYGAKVQFTTPADTTTPLTDAEKLTLQQVIGCLLYYARAVDPTMLVVISTLASAQANGTASTTEAMHQLLDYCDTHSDAEVRFHSSDMVLQVSSNASYLSEPEARSRTSRYFYLGNNDDRQQEINGPIICLSSIIKHVISSAAEAEIGSIFSNAKDAAPLRVVLEEMGHNQPPTPIQTENSTAYGIVNNKLNEKRSKAMDMRFYWVRDRIEQKQYKVYWEPALCTLLHLSKS